MCVICYKPANEEISDEYLDNMLSSNPDGAGYVYFDKIKKEMVLSKGYLDKKQAKNAIKAIPKNAPAIIHCRIKTHGENEIGQTHPFPVVADTKLLEKEDMLISGGYVMAHNGIFHDLSIGDKYSDTEAFICKILAPLADVAKDKLLDDKLDFVINTLVKGNKIAIMDGKNGNVKLYGEGWKTVGKLSFSNSSYLYKPYYYSNSSDWKYNLKQMRVCAINGDVNILKWNSKAEKWEATIEDLAKKYGYGAKNTKYYADYDGNVYALYYEKGNLVKMETICIDKPYIYRYYSERNATTLPYREWYSEKTGEVV